MIHYTFRVYCMCPSTKAHLHYQPLQCGVVQPLWIQSETGCQRRACLAGVRLETGLWRGRRIRLKLQLSLFKSLHPTILFATFWTHSRSFYCISNIKGAPIITLRLITNHCQNHNQLIQVINHRVYLLSYYVFL